MPGSVLTVGAKVSANEDNGFRRSGWWAGMTSILTRGSLVGRDSINRPECSSTDRDIRRCVERYLERCPTLASDRINPMAGRRDRTDPPGPAKIRTGGYDERNPDPGYRLDSTG